VSASVCAEDDWLRLAVRDAGPGFNFDLSAADQDGRLGLAGMRERAQLLGGTFEVQSAVGAGTTVRASWPLPDARSG
jgi:signal transduction histidine kinase